MSTKNKSSQTAFQQAMAAMSWRNEIPARRERFKSLTEHIKDDRDRRVTEVLCENQLGRLSSMRQHMVDEATLTSDVSIFNKYALKIIPRVYPSLFVKDLISIQPIPLPTALVFYKDFLRDPSGTPLNVKADFNPEYGDRGPELSPVPQIMMTITSANIVATAKAIGYEFSVELDQDLMAYHGLSADPELGAQAAMEIQREIEYDIISELLTGAGAGNVNWNAIPPSGDTNTINIEAYNKTLFHAVIDARNLVFKQRYTYPTWMITSPDFAVRFEKMAGFEYDQSYNPGTLMQGRQFFGTIRNIISIYVDPWFPNSNMAVLGYKGVTDFDVGLVYSPYIPFYSTQLFENPQTLGKTRSLLSRQAITMLVPEMYSTLSILNANS